MAQKKYVSLEKLISYDAKIKGLINEKDSAILDSAKSYADSLSDNYEQAGSVATAKTELQKGIDNSTATAEKAQAAADKAQGEIDALETLVGTIPEAEGAPVAKDVISYIDKKTEGIATDAALSTLQAQVNTNKNDIADIKADYLKAADKTSLSESISAEKDRAEGIESGLRTDVDAIKNDYLKAADKSELETSIAAAKKAGDDAQADIDAFMAAAEVGEAAVDTLKEIQEYITTDGEAAAEMTANISKNADAITAVEGRTDTLEGKMTAVEGKASANEESITKLQAADTGILSRLDAVEKELGNGEGSVTEQIDAAKQAAIDAASADATTKANQALTDAKAYTDTEVGKDRDRIEALEAVKHNHDNKEVIDEITSEKVAGWDSAAGKVHEHANKAELDKIAVGDKAKWDAAEGNAKAYADDINTALTAKIEENTDAIAAFVECSEEDINAMFSA